MKKTIRNIIHGMALATILGASSLAAATAQTDEVLVTVGKQAITASELQMAVSSSPFATQFIAMDEDDQAALRGDLLRRLVIQKLLLLEAERQKLADSPTFQKELNDVRMGLLYRYYMDKLRAHLEIPADMEAQFKQENPDDADALTAARSAYLADRYREVRQITLQMLQERYHVKVHDERIGPDSQPDTELLSGDGLSIRYADVVDAKEYPTAPNPEWIKEQLYKRAELIVIAKAAAAENVDVAKQLQSYRNERLPALLLEQKNKEWKIDEQAMHAYYDQHPDIGLIPERRHIGQLVVATREEAEKMRQRIEAGESLFTLAGQYSIDDYGRKHNGDLGWIREDRGMPEIRQALTKLEDGQLSDIIHTDKGYHLVTIIERRPRGRKEYEGVKDRVQQRMMSENLAPFLGELEKRFGVTWPVMAKPEQDKG